MNLETLQKFLDKADIPRIESQPKTFLGITKQPHYENVMSNIYAFYFDVNEEHGLKDLFILALTELINEKLERAVDVLSGFNIETEYPTNKGGRIDLLLWNDDEAIIIENKVYHILNNDLEDYLETVKQKHKTGIVLSLYPVAQSLIQDKLFINILHYDLLQRVMDKVGPYHLSASDKYLVYLKDFYQNTINLSKPMNRENVNFYYQNQDKVNTAFQLRNAVLQEIKREVEKVGTQLKEEVISYSSRGGEEDRLKHFMSPSNSLLNITIVFDGLMEVKRELTIMIKLFGKEIEKGQRLDKGSFTESEKVIIHSEFYKPPTSHCANFAENSYELSAKEVENLSSFITKRIEEDGFLTIYRKLNAHLAAINAKEELG
jgi:hypothetical protein